MHPLKSGGSFCMGDWPVGDFLTILIFEVTNIKFENHLCFDNHVGNTYKLFGAIETEK